MNLTASQHQNSSWIFKVLILMLVVGSLVLSGCHRHHRSAPVSKPQSTIVKRQLNSDGSYYVRSGDTLYAIAFSYGLDPMEVARKNGIYSPYTIYPGQKIQLKAPDSTVVNRDNSSGVQINTVKTPGQVTTKTIDNPKPTTRSTTAPVTTVSTSPPKTSSVPPVVDKKSTPAPVVTKTTDPESWQWPTDGRVIRRFVAGNPARNGLDIAGKEGQAIMASAGGQVVYSGNGLIGYGELIIIKHSEKMLSAYAHNRLRLVKEGDQVWAGQKIAEMGRNSGDEQLLHFEIRSAGKPVNPLNYLPKN